MTNDQRINREERIAIMMFCADCFEGEARRYCDEYPDLYGQEESEGIQLELLPRRSNNGALQV